MKLRNLECESLPQGCVDFHPDAKRADSKVVDNDPVLDGSGGPELDNADARLVARDVLREGASQPDTGSVALADGAPAISSEDGPQDRRDALALEIGAGDTGTAPDAGRPLAPDSRLAETGLPDVAGGDVAVAPDAGLAEVTPARDTNAVDVGPALDAVLSETVTFSVGKAKGAMTGNGWVTMGIKDTVTSPTCGPSQALITASAGCSASETNWDPPNALCVSGVVPALPASPSAADYGENWGLKVGVNANDVQGSLGRSFNTVSFSISGTPNTGLRAVVHLSDSADLTYCAFVNSSAPIPLTSFNTSCWNSQGTNLSAADLSKIDHIGIQVSSTSQEITVTRLCLSSIVFGM